MIDWSTRQGKEAISFIKKEIEKGTSYRQIALLINELNILPEVVTSEQVRGAKRYHIDNINRKKLDKEEDKIINKTFSNEINSNEISSNTKEMLAMFQKMIPILDDKTVMIDRSLPCTTSRNEEAVLMLSGCNVQDESFFAKMDHIKSEVKRIHYKQKASSRIDVLHILMAGDMVIGMREYADAEFVNRISTVRIEEMYRGVAKTAELLISLLTNFKHIRISAVCNIQKKNEMNWDVMFYAALEKMLGNYRKRISFNYSFKDWLVKSINGHRFLLMHEGKVSSLHEYQSYKTDNLLNAFENKKEENAKSIEYVCTSDHHRQIHSPYIREHIMNGSFQNELLTSHWKDYQYFFGVDVDGISWRYKI